MDCLSEQGVLPGIKVDEASTFCGPAACTVYRRLWNTVHYNSTVYACFVVTQGLLKLEGFDGETVTNGLETLSNRCQAYYR